VDGPEGGEGRCGSGAATCREVGLASTRSLWSSSLPELEEDKKCEKREEAGDREASESELSRRFDAAPLVCHCRCSARRGTSGFLGCAGFSSVYLFSTVNSFVRFF
jgi:hypothetical protein